jgi:Domain of unknown function (DUF4193)
MSDDDSEDDEPEIDEELDDDALVLAADLDDGVVLDDDLAAVEIATEPAELVADVDAEPLVADVDAEPLIDVIAPKPRTKKVKKAATTVEDDDDVVDLDEDLHPDDVEEPLDVLLKERTASATLEDDEEELEEEEPEVDDRGEVSTKIVPRRPGEFLCSSCFLVLPRNQLADEKRMLCRDCA